MSYADLCQWYLEYHHQLTTLSPEDVRWAQAAARAGQIRRMIAEADKQMAQVTSPTGNYPKA